MAERPADLKERAFGFTLRILKIAAELPRVTEAQVVRRQIARSGLSITTNVEEADGCDTRPETRRIFIIARRDARETRVLLRVIRHLWSSVVNVEADLKEATKLIKILSAIIMKLKGIQ
jgi:four helix bundle protein